ncbi:MAG: hypothetical protein A2033_09815 [Bacteroidetes bacterium GWA2_31_9]|nr:MAG: hypothetical protein A2033_09815 [Bacteroidetes bacterium GWA2_31_9]
MKNLLSYFLQGLLLIAPIGLTIFVLYRLLLWIDNILPFKFPGLGLIVILVAVTFLGFIGKTFLARPFVMFFEGIIKRTPFVKIIYTSLKDLFSAFVGKEKKFKHPVLVKINNETNIEKIGFLTSKDLSLIGLKNNKVAVYCPHSYAFSGELIIVPSENVITLNISSAEAMKFIISGGITNI